MTFSCTEPPGCAIAGVMVSSTGSGPVVRFTVDVEMPPGPGGPAPRTSARRRDRKLYGTIDSLNTAGLLIVRELSRPSSKAARRQQHGRCACCCAVSDEVSQGAYLDDATRFCTGMADRMMSAAVFLTISPLSGAR